MLEDRNCDQNKWERDGDIFADHTEEHQADDAEAEGWINDINEMIMVMVQWARGLPSTKFNALIGSPKSMSSMSWLNRFMMLPISVFWKKLKGALGFLSVETSCDRFFLNLP